MEFLPNAATVPQSNQILEKLFTLEKERDVLKAQCISLRNKLKSANNLLLKLKQDPSNKKLEETQVELQNYTNKYQTEIQTLTKELETTRNQCIQLKKQINTNNDRSGTQICYEHENIILELEVQVKEWKKKHTDLQQRCNKKQKMEGIPVSVEKKEYEKMKEELQSLKENYSLLNDENRRLTQCEKVLQSEVEMLRRSNRKECENNKEVLNLQKNYSLVSRENERLKEREKFLEKEIENLKQQNLKSNEMNTNHVAIRSLQQFNFGSMESMSIDNLEESVSSKSIGLGLIDDFTENNEESIENPQIVIQSKIDQDFISGLDLSLSSSEDEDDNNESTGNEEIATPFGEFRNLNLTNSEKEHTKEINPDPFGIRGSQDEEENIARSHSSASPKKCKDFYFCSESEEDETMIESRKNFPNVSDDQNDITKDKPNNKRSIFSPTSLELTTKIKTRSTFDVDGQPSPPLCNQFNVAQKDVEEEYEKLNNSIQEEMEKLNGIKLDLIQTQEQFKSMVKEEKIELDSVKEDQQRFENEMAKQEKQFNFMKIKIESVHEKLNKAIEDQKRNCAKIVILDEEQNKWNLIKLNVAETQKKLSCIAEELKLVKEENKNLKVTLETVLAKNDELCKLNHEMSSNNVNSEYVTVQQATALAEGIARKEIRKYVTRKNAIMKVKLKKERNKLVRIGFKRGRRTRKIESKVVVPNVRICEEVQEDDEVAENSKSVEVQEKATGLGVDGMITCENNEKYDGGKTNNLIFVERDNKNIEEIETINLRASERVKILGCHILKPAVIEDFLIEKTSKNALKARSHDDYYVKPSVDDNNGVYSDDNQDQSFDDDNMPLEEKSPGNVKKMTEEDAQIENHFCLSDNDNDESLIIDESYISDDAEMIDEETKTKKNDSSSNDLILPANSFKRKRSIDESNVSQKIFALSPESKNKTLEEEIGNGVINSFTSLTCKFVKPISELLLDIPIKIHDTGLNSDIENGISLPNSSKVPIFENQFRKSEKKETKRQKRDLKNGSHDNKEVYLQIENAVLMLFEVPSDSMINLLLKFNTKMLCKVIVKLSTEDFECKHTNQMNPIAPILSEYQIVLLRLLIALTKKDETTKHIFLKIAETAILTISSPIHLEPIARLQVAFMKYFYEFPRAKTFIFRALSKMGALAIPYLYFLGTSWPDVFVNYEATSGNDRLLAKTMMKLITFRDIKDPEYFKMPLINFLNQLYKYPCDLEPMDMLLKEIVKQYMWNQCDQLKNVIFIIGVNMSVFPFFKSVLVGFKVTSEEKIGIAVDLLKFLICNISITDKMALQTIEDWISTFVEEDYSEKIKNILLEITTQLNILN